VILDPDDKKKTYIVPYSPFMVDVIKVPYRSEMYFALRIETMETRQILMTTANEEEILLCLRPLFDMAKEHGWLD
jgi:hypothetical protein